MPITIQSGFEQNAPLDRQVIDTPLNRDVQTISLQLIGDPDSEVARPTIELLADLAQQYANAPNEVAVHIRGPRLKYGIYGFVAEVLAEPGETPPVWVSEYLAAKGLPAGYTMGDLVVAADEVLLRSRAFSYLHLRRSSGQFVLSPGGDAFSYLFPRGDSDARIAAALHRLEIVFGYFDSDYNEISLVVGHGIAGVWRDRLRDAGGRYE